MSRLNWNTALEALVLIRLGQELGSDSELARNVASLLDVLIHAAKSFAG